MQNEHEKTIISVLDDNKALDIQHIDVQHLTDISDSIIVSYHIIIDHFQVMTIL